MVQLRDEDNHEPLPGITVPVFFNLKYNLIQKSFFFGKLLGSKGERAIAGMNPIKKKILT
jgi:hypothetical protein